MNKLLFLGDFYYDYNHISEDLNKLNEYINQNDYSVILNLEGSYKSGKEALKWFVLNHNEKVIEALKLLNVKAVNLANNHVLDWGESGLRDLMNDLEENNLPFFGAGLDLKEACEPEIIEMEGFKIGFLGFGWWISQCEYAKENSAGVAPLDRDTVLRQIREIKPKVDKLILFVHWGYEYEKYPLPIHRKLAHDCIDEGVDIIIGHHPHVIQVKETYKGKHIYYSLGNFYFGSRRGKFIDHSRDETGTARYGLGVLWEPESEKVTEIFVDSSPENTKICNEREMEDISDIKMESYNEFFKSNKTSQALKPYFYLDDEFKNKLKISLYKMKVKSRYSVFYLLKELGLLENFKKSIVEYLN